MDPQGEATAPARKPLADIKPVGGHPVIDFLNTVHSRFQNRGDYLESAEDVIQAEVMFGLIPGAVGSRVLEVCRQRPHKARVLLETGIELREALYRIFLARARGSAPSPADMEIFNAILAAQRPRQRLRVRGGGFGWDWELDPADPVSILGPVAVSAAELLTSEKVERVKECPPPDGCGWMFLDTSRNRSRQWCSMSDCGNVAKVRRHRRRRKTAA